MITHKQHEEEGDNYLYTWTFYDGLGRVVQTQTEAASDAQSILVNREYDGLGNLKRESLPYIYSAAGGTYRTPDWGQPQRQYTYDALGRVTQVTNPDNTTVRSYYQDRKAAVIDELNHQTIQEMDALGRLVSVKQYSGSYPGGPGWNDPPYGTTSYGYDVADRLNSVTGPDGAQTAITYDLAGRKTWMSDPDMGAWGYAYDAAGNLRRQTDARNQTVCFYYDALNRLTGKHYRTDTSCPTSNPTLNVSYTYDSTAGGNKGKGRRTGMNDPSGSTSWVYDERGRVTKETKVINGTGGGTFVTQWSYRPDDQVNTMTYPGGNGGQTGETVTTTYNPMGLVESVTGTSIYVGDTTYNALGQVELRKLGSDVLRTDYDYFGASGNFRLQQLKTGTPSNPTSLQDLRYTYDNVGNVLTIKDYKAGSPQTQSFSYDFLDRVVSASVSGGSGGLYSEGYEYSGNGGKVGNLTKKGTTSYTYGTQAGNCPEGTLSKPHAVVTAGSNTYCYDQNGNMRRRKIGATTYTLTYDAENRLTGVSGGASASFVYDGDGRRVKATVNGVTTVYIGDYYEQTGSTVKKYYYAGGQRVAMRENSTLYWLLSDHLGSTAKVASGSNPYGELRYKAWGETRYSWGTTPTTYRFTGQREEASIGLYFYNARWYDPTLGRFVQADNIVPKPGNPQNLNRYTYVLNNPVRHVDPSGHCIPEECPGTASNPERYDNLPLSRQQIALAKQLARQFGIPFEFLAAVLQTQQQIDYGVEDRFEDVNVKAALLIIRLTEAVPLIGEVIPPLGIARAVYAESVVFAASTLDSSLGPAQVRISTARLMEQKFAPRGLLSKSVSTLDILINLETERGNISYVAAYLRHLTDLRMRREEPHFRELTTVDMQIIYGAYRAGIERGYGTLQVYQSASEPGRAGKLLSENALDVYRSDPR